MLPKHKQARDTSTLLVTSRAEHATVPGVETSVGQCLLNLRFLKVQQDDISVHYSHNLESISSQKTVTLIRNSAGTEPSAGSWARKPDRRTGPVGQLSQVEQQTLRLRLLT